jgi:hypothetical protein
MRLRKRDLTRRVNGDLAIQFGDERLTSYAGLEILMRYLRQVDVNGRLRDAFGSISFRGDYPELLSRVVYDLLGGDLLDTIHELHTLDHPGQEFIPIESFPSLLSAAA